MFIHAVLTAEPESYFIICIWYTVRPKKYAHDSCFVLLFCGQLPVEFTIFLRVALLAAIIWLPQCQWSNLEEYGCVGVGGFSKVVATFNHVGGSCNLFMATTRDVWIIPSFSNLGLCAARWARFMCHHELWPTSVSHPFSFLYSSLGLAGGKHFQKITISVFRVVFQNFAIPGCFIFFYCYILLTLFWFICYCSMWLCFSQGTS